MPIIPKIPKIPKIASGINPKEEKYKEKLPTLEEIKSRNEVLSATPLKKRTFIGKKIQRLRDTGVGRDLEEGLFGIEDPVMTDASRLQNETMGQEAKRKGILGFLGIAKKRSQKILDREIELQRDGIKPGRAAQIAALDVPEKKLGTPLEQIAAYESNKKRRERLQKELGLTEEEEKALKRVTLFEQIDHVGNLLDVGTFGATVAPKKFVKEMVEKVAKEASEKGIKDIILSYLPKLDPKKVDEIALLTKNVTEEDDVAEILNKQIVDALDQAPEGQILKESEDIIPKVAEEVRTPKIPPVGLSPESQLDEVIPSSSIVPQEKSAVDTVIEALKKAKPIRGKQEAIYSKERSKRLGQAMAVGQKIKGEAGLPAQLSKLKGEIPKVEFESLRKDLTQGTIDELFETAKNSPELSGFEKIRAQEALAKLFGEYGGQVPTRGELALLEKAFPKQLIDELLDKRPLLNKFVEAGLQLANIPRSLMSGFLDLSFGGRQGLFVAPRYRKEFYDSWKRQFKIFGSEKAYKASEDALKSNPRFELAKEAGISFTDVGGAISGREERFASSWAEKIPVIGKGIRATGRAYTAFANKFRLDIFSSMVKDAENLGLNPVENTDLLREIANFVNAATGRGSLGILEDAAPALNAFFFSPRLMASRLTLLNPVYYIRQDPFVRKEALKSLLTFGGTAATMLGLVSLIPGVEVGTDPRSADFGKIKIGNTRVDIAGGFQQYIRMAAQLISGEYVSTTSGKEYTLGEGYKPVTRYDILLRQIESKEAPIFSFITSILRQQDYAGQPVSVQKELLERITPMIISDAYDLAKDDPSLLPLEILAIFGASVQTYQPAKDKKKVSSGFPSVPRLPKLNVGPSIPKIPKLPKITR